LIEILDWLSNAAGYNPGLVTPSPADLAQLEGINLLHSKPAQQQFLLTMSLKAVQHLIAAIHLLYK